MSLTKVHNRMVSGAAVNVKDFGAVGDGVTDDTAAIQAAINYAYNSKIYRVKLGVKHKVTSTIRVQALVTLEGYAKGRGTSGNEGTLIDGSSMSSGSVIKLGLDTTDPEYTSGYNNEVISIQNFTVKGNISVNGIDAPTTASSKDLFLDNIGALECQNGFVFRRNWSVKARGLYTFGIAANGASLITTQGLSTSVFESCVFYSTNTGTVGIQIENSGGAEAYSSTSFISCAVASETGLVITAPDANGLSFINPHFEDCSDRNIHINLTGSSPTTGQIIFYSPSFATLPSTMTEAIYIQDASEVVFKGLQIYSGRLNGQKLLTIDAVTRNVIFENLNCKTDTDATGDISELFSASTVIVDSYVYGYLAADRHERINYMVGGEIEDPVLTNKLSIGESKDFALGVNKSGNQVVNVGLSSGGIHKIQFNESDNYSIQSNGSSYMRLHAGGGEVARAQANGFVSGVDGGVDLGSAAKRWDEVFATTGTINTSDEREKTELVAIEDTEILVARELKQCIKKYRFLNSVEEKGDQARIHFGVGAQTVRQVFEKHGLDPNNYSLFCYDEWEADEDTPAGNRYGIRYDELLAFILAAL